MTSSSIRTRLTLAISGFMALVLIATSFLVFHTVKASLLSQVDSELTTLTDMLAHEIEWERGKVEHEWLEDLHLSPSRMDRDYIQVWDQQTGASLKSPILGKLDLPNSSAESGKLQFEIITLRNGVTLRTLTTVAKVSGRGGKVHPQTITYAHDIQQMDAILLQLLIAIPIVLLLSTLLSFFVIRSIIRSSLSPIQRLSQNIEDMDADSVGCELNLPDNIPSELTPLAQQYQSLLSRIQDARTRERNFSAHAAHELRTPLAGIHGILQQMLNRERCVEDYKKRVGEALSISQQMRSLVNHLMRFSQFQSKSPEVECTKIEFTLLLEAQISTLTSKAKLRGLNIELSPCENHAEVFTDKNLLEIVISNLLNNAITYAEADSSITLKITSLKDATKLSISNFTSELSQQDLKQLSDPFFRKDSVRSVEQGNFGLGLSIVHQITKALDIELETDLSSDNLFTIALDVPRRKIR